MSETLNGALEHTIKFIPDCLAAGYIDISCGMLISIRSVESHPIEIIEVLADATTDLFQGSNVRMIETIFKKARGLQDDTRHYFQEFIANSDNLIHIFLRCKENVQHVACFVCLKSANLGMVLTRARACMPALEESL